jgi:2-dehydro-3-deoxyphosphogalactonate aldolase
VSGLDLQEALAAMPLVAILRGVKPEEVLEIAAVLVEAGIRVIEVPLNSPDPFRSIALLAEQFKGRALIGGGTVMTPDAARRIIDVDARLVVMPHSDPQVIRAAKAAGGLCVPGVATPTEGFAALAVGADALKLFPGEALPPPALKAWKAVFPPSVPMLPVGGITPETMAAYVAAGAAGFGIGSALYKPGFTADEVAKRAAFFVQAWRTIVLAKDVVP